MYITSRVSPLSGSLLVTYGRFENSEDYPKCIEGSHTVRLIPIIIRLTTLLLLVA